MFLLAFVRCALFWLDDTAVGGWGLSNRDCCMDYSWSWFEETWLVTDIYRFQAKTQLDKCLRWIKLCRNTKICKPHDIRPTKNICTKTLWGCLGHCVTCTPKPINQTGARPNNVIYQVEFVILPTLYASNATIRHWKQTLFYTNTINLYCYLGL